MRTDVTRQQVDRNFVRLISLEDDSRFRPRLSQERVERVVLAEYFAARTPYYCRAKVSGFSINNGIDYLKMNDTSDLKDLEDERIFVSTNRAIEQSGIIVDLIWSN